MKAIAEPKIGAWDLGDLVKDPHPWQQPLARKINLLANYNQVICLFVINTM